jgi:hypothetical protein
VLLSVSTLNCALQEAVHEISIRQMRAALVSKGFRSQWCHLEDCCVCLVLEGVRELGLVIVWLGILCVYVQVASVLKVLTELCVVERVLCTFQRCAISASYVLFQSDHKVMDHIATGQLFL